jgi:Myotubularin-like phosphatase domain
LSVIADALLLPKRRRFVLLIPQPNAKRKSYLLRFVMADEAQPLPSSAGGVAEDPGGVAEDRSPEIEATEATQAIEEGEGEGEEEEQHKMSSPFTGSTAAEGGWIRTARPTGRPKQDIMLSRGGVAGAGSSPSSNNSSPKEARGRLTADKQKRRKAVHVPQRTVRSLRQGSSSSGSIERSKPTAHAGLTGLSGSGAVSLSAASGAKFSDMASADQDISASDDDDTDDDSSAEASVSGDLSRPDEIVPVHVRFPDFQFSEVINVDQDWTVADLCARLTALVVKRSAAGVRTGTVSGPRETEAELRQRLKLFGLYIPVQSASSPAASSSASSTGSAVPSTPSPSSSVDSTAKNVEDYEMAAEDPRGTWLAAGNPLWSYYLTEGDTLSFQVSPHEVHKQHTLGRVSELDTLLYLRVEIFTPNNEHTETHTHRFERSTIVSEVCRTLARKYFPDADFHHFVDAVSTNDARYRFGLYAVTEENSDVPAVLLDGSAPLAQCDLRNMDTVQFRPTEQFELLPCAGATAGHSPPYEGGFTRSRTQRVRKQSIRRPTVAGGAIKMRPVLIDKGVLVSDAIQVLVRSLSSQKMSAAQESTVRDTGAFTLRTVGATGARFLARTDLLDKSVAVQDVVELRQVTGGGVASGDGAGGMCLASYVVRRVPASATGSRSSETRGGFPMFGGEVVYARALAIERFRTGFTATIGDVSITNFRVAFVAHSFAHSDDDVHLPLSCIHRVQKNKQDVRQNAVQVVNVECKDVRKLKFVVSKVSQVQVFESAPPAMKSSLKRESFYRVLKRLAFPGPENLFAFVFTFPRTAENGWDVFNFEEEFKRLGFIGPNAAAGWRVTSMNRNYEFSDSYPPNLVVPATTSDEKLKAVFKFRSRGRIPALCWRCNRAGRQPTISRAAQPRVGLLQKRCTEDEQLVAEIRENSGSTTLFFMDARPKKNALANTAVRFNITWAI